MNARPIVWNVFDFCMSFVLVVVLNKVINERLGGVGYGIYSLTFLVNASLVLFDAGLSNSITKYISDDAGWKERGGYISAAFTLYIAIFFICLALGVITYHWAAMFFMKYTKHLFLFYVASYLNLLFVFMGMLLSSVLVGRERWGGVVKGNVIFKISSTVITVYVACNYDADMYFFSLVILSASVFKFIYYLYSLWGDIEFVTLVRPQYKYVKIIYEYVRYGFANSVVGFCYHQVDKVVVAKFLGVVDLGIYSFVSQIVNFMYSFVGVFARTYLPVLCRCHNTNDKLKLNSIFFDMFKKTGVIILVLTLFGCLGWSVIIGRYMSVDYADSTYELAMFAFIYLFVRLFEVNSYYFLSAVGELHLFLIATTIVAVFFCALVGLVIHVTGVGGILVLKATLTFCSYSSVLVFSFLRLRRSVNGENRT